MNREIKFRAWDKEKKGMGTVAELVWKPNLSIKRGLLAFQVTVCEMLDVHLSWTDAEDFILMQFTGLHDKNGKEIYEGDIVDCNGVGHVVYIDCGFYIQWEEGTWDCLIENCEVIGNVHQNPELLEVKK